MFYILLLLYFTVPLLFYFSKYYYKDIFVKYIFFIYKYVFINSIRPKIRSPGYLSKILITRKQIKISYNII